MRQATLPFWAVPMLGAPGGNDPSKALVSVSSPNPRYPNFAVFDGPPMPSPLCVAPQITPATVFPVAKSLTTDGPTREPSVVYGCPDHPIRLVTPLVWSADQRTGACNVSHPLRNTIEPARNVPICALTNLPVIALYSRLFGFPATRPCTIVWSARNDA